MPALIFPITLALSVALGVWSLARFVLELTDGDKRKLHSRLTLQRAAASAVQKSIRNDMPSEGIEGKLLQFKLFRNIDAMLKLSTPDVELKRFVLTQVIAALGAGLIVFAISMNLLVALVTMVLGASVPVLILVRKKISRQRMLDDQLPDAMDFMGRALRAGHSLSSSLQMMGNELPKPIAGEFAHAFAQHSLGISMDKVLKDMTKRVDSTDFAFFITAVLIQRQTGGDLSEVLKNISGMIRQRIRLQQQVKAKTAEGRFTGYILTAFPAVMFVVMHLIKPDYASKLTDDPMGQKMLMVAFVLQVMGLWCIKKITQVRV